MSSSLKYPELSFLRCFFFPSSTADEEEDEGAGEEKEGGAEEEAVDVAAERIMEIPLGPAGVCTLCKALEGRRGSSRRKSIKR